MYMTEGGGDTIIFGIERSGTDQNVIFHSLWMPFYYKPVYIYD